MDYLLCEMAEVSNLKDASMLEYFIYTLFLWEEQVGRYDIHKLEKYVGILNELLVSDWHYMLNRTLYQVIFADYFRRNCLL